MSHSTLFSDDVGFLVYSFFPNSVVKSLDVETYSSCDADALMTRSASRVVAANALSTDDETHTEAGNEAKRLSRAEVKVSITQHTYALSDCKEHWLIYISEWVLKVSIMCCTTFVDPLLP